MAFTLTPRRCEVCKRLTYSPYSRTRLDQWLCSRQCDEEYFSLQKEIKPSIKGMIGDFLPGED